MEKLGTEKVWQCKRTDITSLGLNGEPLLWVATVRRTQRVVLVGKMMFYWDC